MSWEIWYTREGLRIAHQTATFFFSYRDYGASATKTEDFLLKNGHLTCNLQRGETHQLMISSAFPWILISQRPVSAALSSSSARLSRIIQGMITTSAHLYLREFQEGGNLQSQTGFAMEGMRRVDESSRAGEAVMWR